MEKRFRALRFIGTVYKVLGAITAIVTILGAIGICLTAAAGGAALDQFGNQNQALGGLLGGLVGGVLIAIVTLLYGSAIAISLYALGEGVYLAISVEENTRMTAQLLQPKPPMPNQ